jgi:hypothetical protein
MDNKIEIRSLSRGVTTRFFNDQVKERYGDNETLLEACLIRDWDTMPEIQVKQNTFYFTLNNFMPVFEEKIHVRGKKDKKQTPWMVLHLKFKEKYIKDKDTGLMKPLGQRQILINNIDRNVNLEDVKKAFDGETIVYGSKYVTYNFNNSKEVRLEHIQTEAMGIELIKKCLPFTVQSTLHEGSIEDNILTVNYPVNTPKVDTYGLRGHIWKVSFKEQVGKKTTQLARVLISNSARSK